MTKKSRTTKHDDPSIIKKAVKKIDIQEEMTPRTKKRIDLDKQIENAGLTPLEKIVISDDKDGHSVRYMKAETKLGEPVLIEVDVQGMVATRPEDLKVIEELTIPEELKSKLYLDKVYNETGMEFQGVSMECKDGVCVMSRDERMRPIRTFLKKTSTDGSSLDLDVANVLPIVRFSDIVQNGTLIQQDISKAFKNLRNILYIEEKQKLKETDQYLANLHENFQESIVLIKTASEDLESSIQTLTGYADIYQESGVEDIDDRDKYRMVIENLKIRNEKVLELIGALRTFNQMHGVVKKLDETVASVKNTLIRDFQRLDENLSS
jgi:uncharacterized protein YdeI (YjbR/CyaY-like superfamily)